MTSSRHLNPGDKIKCKLKDNVLVNAYETDYDEIIVFEILARDEYGYCVYIPHYLYLNNCVTLDSRLIADWDIDSKFLNEKSLYIRENLVFKVDSVLDGMSCSKCKEFFNKASANQEDGTLICWSCRKYRYH